MKHLPRWFTLLLIAVMLTVPAAVYAAEDAPVDTDTTDAITAEEEDTTVAFSTAMLLLGVGAISVVGLVWISQDTVTRPEESSTN